MKRRLGSERISYFDRTFLELFVEVSSTKHKDFMQISSYSF